MSKSYFSFSAMRRNLSVAAIAGGAFTVAGAQTTSPQPVRALASQPVDFASFTPSTAPLTSFSDASSSSSSSTDSSDAASMAADTNLASLEKGMSLPGVNAQYGRRRYGAPRYRGSNSNADGSEKYDGFVGGGVTLPIGDTHRYYKPSWTFQVGAGRNFNKNYGVNLQFDWDEFGLQGSNIQQQTYIYDPTGVGGLQGYLDAYSHVWSISVDPIYYIKSGEGLGAYVTAGAGFYHKVTTFTTPQQETFYYYGFPQTVIANVPFDSYTSNAPGFNGGFGLTYKFSRFANERLYAEVRYVVTLNSQRQGINGSNYNSYASSNYTYPTTDLYPANSNRSTYIPVKFGIRF